MPDYKLPDVMRAVGTLRELGIKEQAENRAAELHELKLAELRAKQEKALAELAGAARRQGLAFGTYHSVCDWYHPDFPLGSPGGKTKKSNPNMDRYNQYLKNQLANYQAALSRLTGT